MLRTILVGIGVLWGLCIASADAQVSGIPDTTFGEAGWQTLNLDQDEYCSTLLTDPSGNTYLLGSLTHYTTDADLDYFIAKLDTDGEIDPSFSNGGLLRGDFGGHHHSRIVDAALTDDGLYFIGEGYDLGTLDSQDVYIGKVDLDGNWDTGFAQGGLYHRRYVGTYASAGAMHVLADGKLLYCGMTTDTNVWHIEMPLVARLLPDGRPDSSFGGTGCMTWSLRNGLASAKVGAHSDGLAPAKVTAHSDGLASAKVGAHSDGGRFETVLPVGGHYLLGGYFFTSSVSKAMVMMVDAAGNLCTDFGIDGLLFPELNPGLSCGIVDAVQRGPDIFLAVQADVYSTGEDMAILQMDSLGAGLQYESIDFFQQEDRVQTMLVDRQGHLVLAGYSRLSSHNAPGWESDALAVACLNDPQTPFSSFGIQGRSLLQIYPDRESGAFTLCETPDGKLMVAGYVNDTASGNYTDLVVVRVENAAVVTSEVAVERRELRLYPNPAGERVYVEGRGRVRVYDIWGNVVLDSVHLNTEPIAITCLKSGIYILDINGKAGRFVKE